MNRTFACGILILALTTPAFGQWRRLTLGAETGVPLNDAFKSAPSYFGLTVQRERDGRKAWAGISAETPLPWHLSVRGAFLYRRLAFHRTTQPSRIWRDIRGHAWELPVTVKRQFAQNYWIKPFVDAGIAVRYTDVTMQEEFSGAFQTFRFPSKARDWHGGTVLGTGMDIDVLPVRLSPEVRWTAWLDNWPLGLAQGWGPSRNSVDFVLGFKFK